MISFVLALVILLSIFGTVLILFDDYEKLSKTGVSFIVISVLLIVWSVIGFNYFRLEPSEVREVKVYTSENTNGYPAQFVKTKLGRVNVTHMFNQVFKDGDVLIENYYESGFYFGMYWSGESILKRKNNDM